MNAPNSIKPWAVFALVCTSVFLTSLDATVLFVAFQAMCKSFPTVSPAQLSWVLNAYTIVYAALLVPAGRLADLYGRKRLFLIGVTLFTLGSACCGIAPSAYSLIAMRIVQAIGAALLTPASLALILANFPKEKQAIVVSLWGAVAALAAAAGPSLGALIIETWGWQWAFFINVPVGLFSLVRGMRMLQESKSAENAAPPDILGIVLLIAGVGALALAIVQSDAWGWTDRRTAAAIGAGIVALVAFFVWAPRVAAPALDITLFRDPNYLFANIVTLIFGIAFTTMFFSFFFFMTQVWGYSLLRAGFAVTPGPLLVIPVAIVSGRYAAKNGHRPVLVLGGLIYALGSLWF
jgi:EmrB/QacA subfamily drug resistance transporter